MLFNSTIFVVFLLVVLLVYYPLPQRAKIGFLLVMSFLFYGFWDPKLCGLLLLSTVVDFVCGQRIHALTMVHGPAHPGRRWWLSLSLVANLGMLGFFKYADFFIEEFVLAANLLGAGLSAEDYLLRFVLPAGISFYTFQTMAYTIDIYRREIEPERSFWRFALYVTFFPQLVAGPVERAPHLLPQFRQPFRISPALVRQGIFLILLGFFKKVVIADRLARTIAPYYLGEVRDSVEAASAMLLFTTQIYVDFSSYSDIAIGLGLLLGYHIRPNFNLPFVVPSIPERWRRWHISMSHWFRDYIFIPLGGSRHGTVRTQVNILIIMFLSGLWHGASNNFMVWGLLNGLTMVGHRTLQTPLGWIRTRMNRHPLSRIGYFYLCCLVTYATIASINIFFRCPDWPTALHFVHTIFLSGGWDYLAFLLAPWTLDADLQDGFSWTLLVFLAHESQRYLQMQARIYSHPVVWLIFCLITFAIIVSFGIEGPQFIYYQF